MPQFCIVELLGRVRQASKLAGVLGTGISHRIRARRKLAYLAFSLSTTGNHQPARSISACWKYALVKRH